MEQNDEQIVGINGFLPVDPELQRDPGRPPLPDTVQYSRIRSLTNHLRRRKIPQGMSQQECLLFLYTELKSLFIARHNGETRMSKTFNVYNPHDSMNVFERCARQMWLSIKIAKIGGNEADWYSIDADTFSLARAEMLTAWNSMRDPDVRRGPFAALSAMTSTCLLGILDVPSEPRESPSHGG